MTGFLRTAGVRRQQRVDAREEHRIAAVPRFRFARRLREMAGANALAGRTSLHCQFARFTTIAAPVRARISYALVGGRLEECGQQGVADALASLDAVTKRWRDARSYPSGISRAAR